MKIAFMHYHLKPGGVTTALKHQVNAVLQDGDVLILTGEPPPVDFPGNIRHIPDIAYDRGQSTIKPASAVAQLISDAIGSCWDTGCDLLHIHNPTLAKNRRLLSIIEHLRQMGIPLFLQIHDFAEDGRPQVYFRQAYPRDCHYGVVNSRDAAYLRCAGLKPEGLHCLYNAVPGLSLEPAADGETDKVLYPVRAIRRKNLGEAILLSLFFHENLPLVVTLPPNGPLDRRSHDQWKAFVRRRRLRVRFDAGLTSPLDALMRSAAFVVTTSITEGFGYTFLEPWTARKMVWGRNLPPITRDFERQGLNLDHFYEALCVPLPWLKADTFFNTWHVAVQRQYHAFGLTADEALCNTFIEETMRRGLIDFGFLDEAHQQRVIDHLLADGRARRELIALNPFLARPGQAPAVRKRIEHNRQAVQAAFSPSAMKRRLMGIYHQVVHHSVRQQIDKDVLLGCFLRPSHMRLLK